MEYEIGTDPDVALRIVRSESDAIAFDTETTGLTINDRVCGYVITANHYSVYVPVRHGGGGNILYPEEFERRLTQEFAERGRRGFRTVGHNLAFDLKMASRHGVVLYAPLEDTQINEGLVDDNTIGYSLEECARRRDIPQKLGTELYQELARRFGGLADRKQMQNFHKMPGDHPLVVEYAAGDGISTLALWRHQNSTIDQEGSHKAHGLECALIPYVHRTHAIGLRVDAVVAGNIKREVDDKIAEAASAFPPGFNVNSPKDVEQLYRSNGWLDSQFDRTATRKVSFTQKWLETNEIGQAIIRVRQFRKLNESFCEPLVNTFNINGRVHPVLNQSRSDEYGTNTGRFSCSDPNLQAFPKRNEEVGKVVRRLVIPDDGMELFEADFKQQEPRLFAHFSEDKNLLEGYLADPPRDIHTTASLLLNKPREVAKRLGLGMLTGMQFNSLAGHMGYSPGEAKRDWHAFMDAFPGIYEFQRTAQSVARNRGYVCSILGRRFRFPDPQWAYRATSRIIQGNGAEHLKLAFLMVHQYAESLPPGTLDVLMTIHDSIIFQVVRGREDVVQEVVRLMESVPQLPQFKLIVPIPVELGRGSNWAESSYGKNR